MTRMNAVITNANLYLEEHIDGLTTNIRVDREDGGNQGFSGFLLARLGTKKLSPDYTGLFVLKMMQITDCISFADMIGKAVRIDLENNMIVGMGHIIKDLWFYPQKEFDILDKKFNELIEVK